MREVSLLQRQIKPFDILFHKGKTPIARIIKKLTKEPYSHCAFFISDFHLLQLDYKSPTVIKHLEYPRGNYDVYELITPLTEQEKEKVINFIMQRIRTSYDFKLIFSRLFNILIGTPIINSKNKYNCDELVRDALRSVGINLIDDDSPLSPGELAKSKLLRKIEDID